MTDSDGTTWTFYHQGLPQDFDRLLAARYHSSYSILGYFRVYYPALVPLQGLVGERSGSAVQAIAYWVGDDRAVVLNQLVVLDPVTVRDLVDRIVAEHPEVRRVSFTKIASDPSGFDGLLYVTETTEDFNLTLPNDVDVYRDSLGKNLKKQLAYYQNRLAKDFPDFRYDLVEGEAITAADIQRIVQLNHARMNYKGRRSGIDEGYEKRIEAFSQGCGFLGKLTAHGAMVAGVLCYRVDGHYYMHIIAHDPAFNDYRAGKICLYLTIRESIARQGTDFHMLWGENEYKDKFGCQKVGLFNFTVFQDPREFRGFRFRQDLKKAMAGAKDAVSSSIKRLIKGLIGWNHWKKALRKTTPID